MQSKCFIVIPNVWIQQYGERAGVWQEDCWKQYLLILVGSDRGEDCFWEGERLHSLPRRNRLDGGKIVPTVFTDDMHAWLVFVHGMKNNLDQRGKATLNRNHSQIDGMHKYVTWKISSCRKVTFLKMQEVNLTKYSKAAGKG